MLRIAVDARELEGKPTGVGRYLGNLLRTWLQDDGGELFTLYHRGDLEPASWMESERLNLVSIPTGKIKSGLWWQQVALVRALRRDKPDILFAPADTMPLKWNGPTLLTVHDISYKAHPEWFGAADGLKRRITTKASLKKATTVLAISHFTRDEIVARYGIPESRIKVIYHGIDDALVNSRFTSESDLRSRLGIEGSFALVVGSIFERRFPLETIGAFKHLRDLDLHLVLAGEDRRRHRGDLPKKIREMGLEDRVRWLEYCSETDLMGLYRATAMLIYVSAYEGFGLPPLEATRFGLPCIVSGGNALGEIYGESALTIADENEINIAEAVRQLAEDKSLRQQLVRRGYDLADRLTLIECARKTLALINDVAAGRK